MNAVANNRFGQAYIFAGPRGTGKTSVARILAAAVNCQNPKNGEPCGKCSTCEAVAGGNFIDLIEIDAASFTGVDNIRELTSKIHLAPSSGKFKVYIIDEAHMLSKGAFNALLKTLEEPPPHVIFILATTEPYRLPQTILSRCQRFDFSLINSAEIAEALNKIAKAEKLAFKKDVLTTIARQARGSMRDALSLLEQVSYFQNLDEESLNKLFGLVGEGFLEKLADHILAGDLQAALKLINDIYNQGYDPLRFVESWANYLRGLLFIKIGARRLLPLSDKELEASSRQAEKLSADKIRFLIEQALATASRLKRTEFAILPLELMVVEAIEEKKDQPALSGPAVTLTEVTPLDLPQDNHIEPSNDDSQNWLSVVSFVQQKKPSLAVILKQAQVKPGKNGAELAFASHFYQQLIDRPANRKMVEEAFSARWPAALPLTVIHQEKIEPTLQYPEAVSTMKKDEQLLNDVYKVFGKELS